MTLQEWTTRIVTGVAGLKIGKAARSDNLVPTEGHTQPGEVAIIPDRAAVGDQLGEEARKKRIQYLRPARLQRMSVLALGHTASLRATGGKHIALDNGDSAVEIGQHPGSKQTAHTCPQHDRMPTNLRHGDLPIDPKESRPRQAWPVWGVAQWAPESVRPSPPR